MVTLNTYSVLSHTRASICCTDMQETTLNGFNGPVMLVNIILDIIKWAEYVWTAQVGER